MVLRDLGHVPGANTALHFNQPRVCVCMNEPHVLRSPLSMGAAWTSMAA